ncbi:hypothetical protein [Simiduia aestuariiviva]|uniref:Uncharacterized protein n=1 Tax=Simiduia aestuariiviva TaxID=1510459 RepID=A0A839UPR6_9GAMM|nr:hypothetical protein [Simiduia aestuariiviva]MBB3167417.1 hypothetical protein [Simiduia aestuariiviva]
MYRQILTCLIFMVIHPSTAADCAGTEQVGEKVACFDKALECTKVTAAMARLVCYDTVLSNPQAAPQEAAIEQAFPSPEAQQAEAQSPVLRSTITQVAEDARKYRYLTLANGHIWREKEASRFRYKVGDQVRIEKGALSSNQLFLEGRRGMVRVERVK